MSFYQIGSARRAKNAAFFPLFTLLRDSSIVASLLLSTYFWVVYHSSYLSFARLEKCSDCHKVADHKSIKSRRLDLPPWFLKAFSHSYWPISMSYVLQVVLVFSSVRSFFFLLSASGVCWNLEVGWWRYLYSSWFMESWFSCKYLVLMQALRI